MPVMTTTVSRERDLAGPLDHLRALPFIRDLRIDWPTERDELQVDGLVTLHTPRRTFTLGLEVRRAFLDRAATSGLIAEHLRLQRKRRLPLLLAARYVPRPTGERLVEAGVNFVDRAGNIHLRLGGDHHVLVLGRRDPQPAPTARRPSPALIQILFVLLADAGAAVWPVRTLAEAAGIGRTAAATARQRLMAEAVLGGRRGACEVIDRKRLADQFVDGYHRILRSHLLVGRFRAPARSPNLLLEQLGRLAHGTGAMWAVTGGQAAYALQHFYRHDQVEVFSAAPSSARLRALRLVPDREGPIVLLRAFSRYCAWRQEGDLWLAHPWLIYAELLHQAEPRSLEAADQLREEYLDR